MLAQSCSSEEKRIDAILTTEEVVFDPMKAKGYQQFQVLNLMLDTLVRKDSKFEIISGVSNSWKISNDKRNYTFNISENAKFHNGDVVKSKDVEFTFKRILEDSGNSLISSYLKNVIETIECNGDQQFVINLKKPYAPFLELLSMSGYGIISHKSADNVFIGSGPFKFKSFKDGVWYFENNKEYLFEKSNVESYSFRIERNADITVAALNENKIQLAMGSPLEVALDPKLKKNIVSSPTFSLVSTQLYLNINNSFFKLKANRVHFDELVSELKKDKSILTKFDTNLDTFFPEGIMPPSYYSTKTVESVTTRKNSKKVSLKVLFPKGIFLESSIQKIVKFFETNNITLEYKVEKGKDLITPIVEGNFDLVFLPYQGVINDPDGYTDLLDPNSLLKKASIPTESLISDLEKIRFISDKNERLTEYEVLFKKFEAEKYIIPFSQNSIPIVYSDKLKLPELNFSCHLNLREISY